MKTLQQKFHQLNEREQLIVVGGAIILLVAIFYGAIWAPLSQAEESNRVAVAAKQSELAWVQQKANKAIQLKAMSGRARSFQGSLTQAVNQTASRAQIALSRMQPQGDELKVWIDEAPFDNVLTWLQQLEASGIKIINIDITETNTPGSIKIRNLQLGKS